MIGQTISHYKILEKLGEGGMGVVYKARHLKLDSFVALKFLPPHLVSQEAAKKRFIHEAKAASSLQHPNICAVHDIDETPDGRLFIVMPCYEGETLQKMLERGRLEFDEALDITMQIASGLAKAHEIGITHRDIKPGNILVTNDGLVKVVDFGLAKLAGQTKVTKTGTTVGTISYMSPEQASGTDVDPRSDVFSLGVVFYELLSGTLPFGGDHEAAVIYSIMNKDPDPLEKHRSGLPQALQRVVERALAKDRSDRYPDATDLLSDLTRLKEGRQIAALYRKRKIRIRSRMLLSAVIGLLAVAVGYSLSQLILRSRDNASPMHPTTVAVLPFSVSGGEEFTGFGEGIVELLSTKLDGAGTLRSVDSRAVMSYVKGEINGTLDSESGRKAATHLGAGLYLLGDIMGVGDKMHISASLYGSNRGGESVARATVEGKKDLFLTLVDELAVELLKDRLGDTNEFPFEKTSVTTRSYSALKAYLEGEREFCAHYTGHIDKAIDAFRRAVDEDSTFALAWYRLAVSFWWPMSDLEKTRGAIEQALRYSAALPDHERLHVQAFREFLYDHDENAEQLYRTIVSNYPDDYEAWHKLGCVQVFNAYRRGRSPSEGREALERALTLDPNGWQSFYHLTVLALYERNYEEVEGLVRRRWPVGGVPMRYRANLAFAVGDREAQDKIISELRSGEESPLTWSVFRIALYTDDPLRSQDVARLMTDPVRSDEVRGVGHIILAYLEAARGRWQAAKAEFTAAERFNSALAIEFRALVAAAPFLEVPRKDLDAIRDNLTLWDPHDIPPSVSPQPWFEVYDGMHPHLRVYLLGLVSAQIGDFVKTLQYAEELERMDGQPHVTGLIRDLAHGLRAQVAWKQGDPKKALEELQQMHMSLPARYRVWSPFFKQSHERYLRAELLHELGRNDEALSWTSSFGLMWGFEFVYEAPLQLRRGEYYERMGRPDKAAEHYGKFVELWRDCDKELRPLVLEAEDRLRKL